jgi:hypothetical protein
MNLADVLLAALMSGLLGKLLASLVKEEHTLD